MTTSLSIIQTSLARIHGQRRLCARLEQRTDEICALSLWRVREQIVMENLAESLNAPKP